MYTERITIVARRKCITFMLTHMHTLAHNIIILYAHAHTSQTYTNIKRCTYSQVYSNWSVSPWSPFIIDRPMIINTRCHSVANNSPPPPGPYKVAMQLQIIIHKHMHTHTCVLTCTDTTRKGNFILSRQEYKHQCHEMTTNSNIGLRLAAVDWYYALVL